MPSIVHGFEYDIFISYRQKDNRSDQWVTSFVKALREELDATFKEEVTIYFDSSAHDGLLETHDVDGSLKEKIKCLIFIPIVSQTYCDPKSFAWQKEFLAFIDFAKSDQFGLDTRLANGNVAKRVLPVRIHEIDESDKRLFEHAIGGVIRPVDFIFKSAGVNRSLTATDKREENSNKTFYRDQVNKTANAVKEIIAAIKNPASIPLETESWQPLVKSSPKSKYFLTAFASLIILAVAYFLYSKINPSSSDEGIDKSIAVLPFADMSPAQDQEYFGDGVAEEIINVLAQAPDLKVIARTSSFQFKGKNEDLRTIGKILGVATLLEGSVRKYENKVRITAQLIKVEDGTHLWSKTFDSESANIFNVQDEIAASIASALKATLSPQVTSESNELWNEEAYKLYQTGRYFFDRGGIDDTKKAKDYFEKSIAIDSSHAITWAYLAASEFGSKNFTIRNNKALALDSTDGEALINDALISIGSYNHGRAKEFTERALLYSKSARVLRNSCLIYNALGELENAMTYGKKAIETDPLQPRAFDYLGSTYYFQKKYDSSIVLMKKALELSPEYANVHSYIANSFLMMGKLDEALLQVEKEPIEFSKILGRSIINFARGDKAKADADLQYFVKNAKYWDVNSLLCVVYCLRNDRETGIAYLQKAYEAKEASLSSMIKVEQQLDLIRYDPRFIAILEKFDDH